MSIVREAFIEGRTTKVKWDNSESKKREVKIKRFMDNMETMSSKERNAVIPIQQICPNSGAVLNTFSSRLEAAKYIVSEILKKPGKNPVSITGNMEMCMRAGWKSYGYYWKMMSEAEYVNSIVSTSTTPIFSSTGGKTTIFPSIQAAANAVGMKRTTLSDKLNRDSIVTVSGSMNTYMQKYNNVPQEIKIDKKSSMYKNNKTFFETIPKKVARKNDWTFNNYTFVK